MDANDGGLGRSPLRANAEGGFFFPAATQVEAAARLRFLFRQRRSGGLVRGGVGSGKSTILCRFADECRRAGAEVACVSPLARGPRELGWELAAQWGLQPAAGDDEVRLRRRLSDYARGVVHRRCRAVLVVDDLEQSAPETARHMAGLLGLIGAPGWLTLAAACSDEATLPRELALVETLDLQAALEPWEASESVAAIGAALRQAGASDAWFEPAAALLAHELSGGIPGPLFRLADAALSVAAAWGVDQVDLAAVETAWSELRPRRAAA